MKHIFLIAAIILYAASAIGQERIDLAGKWSFQIDRDDKGVHEKWFTRKLEDVVTLPGSMTTNGKGDDITLHTPWTGSIFDSSYFTKPQYEEFRKEGNIKVPFWLQPVKYYKGVAWYQRTFAIPNAWKNQAIELFIERAHTETTVWIDQEKIGMQNSLGSPHQYLLLSNLKPGQHTITIRVDNRIREINVGPNSHSLSDHTQTNWNGMVGKLELRVRPAIHITGVKIFPDINNKKALVKISIQNKSGKATRGMITCFAESGSQKVKPISQEVKLPVGQDEVIIEYPLGGEMLLWNEFTPNLYQLNVSLVSAGKEDKQKVSFGMRSLAISGKQLTINTTPLFLRGTLECAIFPKTGYPPTDKTEWTRILSTVRSYGLNHVRFHSWCPPEAAFDVADSLGLYLQIECSSWANWGTTLGDGAPIDKYIYDESNRIVDAFGNHPSFCLMTYGNEPGGKNHERYLADFVKYWKAKDARRLYTSGAGWPAIEENDYHNHSSPRIQHWEEGLNSVINKLPPATDYDWSSVIAKWNKPTVSHEIGQWCVFPDLKEIKQYDGVLKAKNFEIFQSTLEKNGMLHLADSFLLASGKLQTLCYKADIEAALRTKSFGGFQLLDLHDFPGQGTALVGVLNPFWKEKGYVTATEFTRFCNTVVPLARFKKMIYYNSESLEVPVEVANYSGSVLVNATPIWTIKDASGKVVFKGEFGKSSIQVGNCITIGKITQSLSAISHPTRLVVEVTLGKFANSWDIFVFPDTLPSQAEDIHVVNKLDAKTKEFLNRGGKVLLTPRKGSIKPEAGGDIAIGFSSIFWNTAWTNGQAPHTLGILCNPAHPAFTEFPTQYHSNWQWWDAMSHSNAIRLDAVDKRLNPIVRVVDDWVKSRPLGLVFECRVGRGKLLVSGIDLITDADKRLEARQLLYSLKRYMSDKSFQPAVEVDVQKIEKLFQ